MRPLFLHLDDALAAQPALLADGMAAGGIDLDARILGPTLRLWARQRTLDALGLLLNSALAGEAGPFLTFFGSGDFHHVTALLVERAAARAAAPVTIVHIDNHPDWVRFRGGMHCGSWVGRAARLPRIARVMTIGPCSADIRQPWRKGADLALIRSGAVELYPFGADGATRHRVCGVERPTIAGCGEAAFLEYLGKRIPTDAVYLTIDKDALLPSEAATNWDQGRLGLGFVHRLIDRLARGHWLVGADICGDWSVPVYGGGRIARTAKRIEAWLDQPRAAPPPAARAINETANRALMKRLAVAA